MTPHYADDWLTVYAGDCRAVLATLPDESVHCVVTSPPYWGLRDYGAEGQLGLEPTPEQYVENMVAVFREVRRVLRNDGTLWLNLGDSYSGGDLLGRNDAGTSGGLGREGGNKIGTGNPGPQGRMKRLTGLKPKDLVGIPWMVARAMQAPYYTGRVKAERDRVWLAAMIDGEGTVCGFDHDRADDGSHRSGVHVAITNTNAALLDEAARIWPTSRSEHQRPSAGHLGTMTSWRWLVHGVENKQAVLRELYPYLIAKRQQAVVAYTLLDLMANAKRLGHSPQKDATLAKRAILTGLLSDLNHQRPVTLPSWLLEPPSMTEPGWYLRSDIIWAKPNPMPESVTDRPTKSHEYLFLLAKSQRYYFDADAVREAAETDQWPGIGPKHGTTDNHKSDYEPMRVNRRNPTWQERKAAGATAGNVGVSDTYQNGVHGAGLPHDLGSQPGRNIRSVWTIPTQPYPGAHFAVFPPKLIEPCIKAGCPELGTVLDPFGGSGTTGMVAQSLSRRAILIDLNPDYIEQQLRRNRDVPLGLTA